MREREWRQREYTQAEENRPLNHYARIRLTKNIRDEEKEEKDEKKRNQIQE